MSKRKPAYCLKHGHVTVPHPCGDLRVLEAEASVSLDKGDGGTQSCDACHGETITGPHRCGRREITEEERAVIQSALALHDYERTGAPNYTEWGSVFDVMHATCCALRKSRESGK